MAFAVFKGFTKGFIIGIFSFLAYFIGLAAALKLSVVVAKYFNADAEGSSRWIPVVSFLIVFITVVLLVNLGARFIKTIARISMMGMLDRLAGILLFVLIYVFIFSVILFFAVKTSVLNPDTVKASFVYRFIGPVGPQMLESLGKILPVFKNMFADLQYFFEKMGQKL